MNIIFEHRKLNLRHLVAEDLDMVAGPMDYMVFVVVSSMDSIVVCMVAAFDFVAHLVGLIAAHSCLKIGQK